MIRRLLEQVPFLGRILIRRRARAERPLLLLGRLLAGQVRAMRRMASLEEVEFRVFSQFGDDGIIQWLLGNIEFPSRTFVEFGVENYQESNTRFLLMNDNWSGLVMDGSAANVEQIKRSEYYARHELTAKAAFIDRDNINGLIAGAGLAGETGILHIDLDGNDYWVWEAIDVISPAVVIIEYNSVFGIDRPVTIPYDKSFLRGRAHHSLLYFGASLRALHLLAARKGYGFIGSNSAGNNAYFVRRDKLSEVVREIPLEQGYVVSKFRESRDRRGRPTFLAGADRLAAIRGMPVHNAATGEMENL